MRAQCFKTKALLINNIIHWFRSAILVDDRTFPIFIQALNVHYDVILCVLRKRSDGQLEYSFISKDFKTCTTKYSWQQDIRFVSKDEFTFRTTWILFLLLCELIFHYNEFIFRTTCILFSSLGEFVFSQGEFTFWKKCILN